MEDPRPLPLGSVLIALALDHALILAGAFLLLTHDEPSPAYGALLLATGILIEVAVILWTLHLAREGRAARDTTPEGAPTPASHLRRSRWICTGCGWAGRQPGAICPRCGRVLVWLSFAPEP